jgi:rhodanese-related sulfurtransferase
MAQFFEFALNNVVLVGIWFALVLALILYISKTGSKAIGTQQAVMLINRQDGVVLDIRDKKDYEAGHIVDSVNIPVGKLGARLAELEKYKSNPIILVCKMGQHSGDACKTLVSAGFSDVVRLSGGMAEWRGQNLPLVQK